MSSSKSRPKLGMNRGLSPDLSALRPPSAGAARAYPPLEVVKPSTGEDHETTSSVEAPIGSGAAPSEPRSAASQTDVAPVSGAVEQARGEEEGPVEVPMNHALQGAEEPPATHNEPEAAVEAPTTAVATTTAKVAVSPAPLKVQEEETSEDLSVDEPESDHVDEELAASPMPAPAASKRPSEIRAVVPPTKPRPKAAKPASAPTVAKRPRTPAAAVEEQEVEHDPADGGRRFHGTFTQPYARKSDGKPTRQTTVSFDTSFDERIDNLMRNNRGTFRTKSAAWIAGMEMLLEQFGE